MSHTRSIKVLTVEPNMTKNQAYQIHGVNKPSDHDACTSSALTTERTTPVPIFAVRDLGMTAKKGRMSMSNFLRASPRLNGVEEANAPCECFCTASHTEFDTYIERRSIPNLNIQFANAIYGTLFDLLAIDIHVICPKPAITWMNGRR